MRKIIAPALLVASLVLSGCGGSISSSELEKQISDQLEKQVGRAPESVDCADDLKAEVGEKGRCSLTDSGATYGIDIEVTEVDGNEAQFDIKVDETPE